MVAAVSRFYYATTRTTCCCCAAASTGSAAHRDYLLLFVKVRGSQSSNSWTTRTLRASRRQFSMALWHYSFILFYLKMGWMRHAHVPHTTAARSSSSSYSNEKHNHNKNINSRRRLYSVLLLFLLINSESNIEQIENANYGSTADDRQAVLDHHSSCLLFEMTIGVPASK